MWVRNEETGVDEVTLVECQGADCGYMFIPYATHSVLCNDCGGNEFQPRVCRVGGGRTDWPTVMKLAEYIVRWGTPNGRETVQDLMLRELGEMIRPTEDG